MRQGFIQACENEQLHLSGAIQPHGCLMVLDDNGLVLHVSANLEAVMGISPADQLSQPPPLDLVRIIQEMLPAEPGQRLHKVAALDGPDGVLDLTAVRKDGGRVLVELFRHPDGEELHPSDGLLPVGASAISESSLEAARDEVTRQVADLTDFQRVLYYWFHEDGDGEVLNEVRQSSAYGSYLGLRFPASDIPQVARKLYRQNPWRCIPDAAAEPVPVLAAGQGRVADLSLSDLRSVSPVHQAYLANMGVRASLSFPIIVGGALAGLIAAHHREPRQPTLNALSYTAQLVRNHSLQLSTFQSQHRMRLVDNLARRLAVPQSIIQQQGGIVSAWEELSHWLMKAFEADGLVLCMDGKTLHAGEALEPAALQRIDHWFCEDQSDSVWMHDSLSRAFPGFPLSQVAGVLALAASLPSSTGELRLYLCRREYIHEVAWGGRPDKPEEKSDGQLAISPRRSFEKWVEKRLGYSHGWSNENRLMALKFREMLLKIRQSLV